MRTAKIGSAFRLNLLPTLGRQIMGEDVALLNLVFQRRERTPNDTT